MVPAVDPQLLGRVGAVLRAAGFTEEGVRGALRMAPGTPIGILDRAVLTRRVTGTDSMSALVRLLVLGSGQPADAVAAAFAPVTPRELVDCGFVTSRAGVIRAIVRVTPYEGLLLAHDPDDGVLGRAHVGGVSPAARTLACLTPRTSAGRALDLGSGCGVQALLAARHISAVVAVDINPRALWLTAINAALNEVSNVEARLGSLYDPVMGEEFDLVVANPPFVISPDHEYVFRDSGMPGDGMSRAVVIGAAGALAPGGMALVLCNWVRAEGATSSPVAAWVAGSGCDVLLLHYETVDPLTYASRWALSGSDSTEDTDTRLDRWLDYYRSNGIESIGLGAVVLRRSSASSPWARTFEMTSGPSGRAGEQLGRMLDAADEAAGVDDDTSVLESVFALVDGHRLNQSLLYGEGGYAVAVSTVTLDDGVGLSGEVDAVALHVVLRIDGRRTLRALVAEAAEETGADQEELASSAALAARRLFQRGFLIRS
jgi:SAM-dependent methyltransferase